MIYDKENLFLDNASVSSYGTTAAYSDVIKNVGKGDAYPNAFIAVDIAKAVTGGGNLTITLQTSTTEAFTTAIDLAAVTVASGSKGEVAKMVIPVGVKEYLRLKLQGSASITGNGKITAGIVLDINQ